MNKSLLIIVVVVVSALIAVKVFHQDLYYNLKLEKLKQEYAIKPIASVDHSKFEVLQKEFKTPQEVTETCIGCHTERHKEVMNSSHWNWERVAYIEGEGVVATGKKSVINNFCIGSNANEQSCAKCHIGFGMTNDHFDFNNARNVDCMVCHDTSHEYLKGTSLAGYPDRTVNLKKVAQSVGQPQRDNCGSCHFNGGGGNNVKHGDLEQAQLACSRDVDVHMAVNGMNMSCTDCHTAENHQILGRLYSVSGTNTQRATCEQCHTTTPHFDDMLNRHNAKVSCQACHIPTYAKVNATKMAWKWSDAGKLKDGKPYEEDDSLGNHVYMTIKGSFEWATNVQPEYIWFNGTASQYVLGDPIESVPVQINELNGSHADVHSKIVPVKVHRGDQIYDKKNNILIQPKLYAPEKGDSAFWQDYDWDEAARAGMRIVGLPYSGEYGFIDTEMYWPLNHMVAPKDQTVGCAECHTRNENGRLAKLDGFYLPGRDRNKTLDASGIFLFWASLLGVVIHAAMRIVSSIRNKRYHNDVIDYSNEN